MKVMRAFLFLAAALLSGSAAAQEETRADSAAARLAAGETFLPGGTVKADPFHERWFGNQLAAMGEQPLWRARQREGDAFTLRILYLPSFHPAHMVRIEASADGTGQILVTGTEGGAGGYDPGQRGPHEEHPLAPQDRKRVVELLSVSRLAAQGFEYSRADGPRRLCMDGMQLLFELVDRDGYHVATRHECELSDGLRALAKTADGLRQSAPSAVSEYWHD
jgi:hypothetical protein